MFDRLSPDKLGTVSFANSCRREVQADFNRALALVHSFWLDEAERIFRKVLAADPACAMANWGLAMTALNQVNGGPTAGGVVWARIALAEADKASEKDARESAYIRAMHQFFDDYSADKADLQARRYTEAMASLAAAYPKDIEAQVFYALALIHSSAPDDLALGNYRKAIAILYPVFRRNQRHPGAAHYIIHATDNPAMAREGLEAARRYAAIAPSAPHALHMPSHIFMRLGLWEEAIRSNLASKAAAENPATHAGAENRLHAMEFLEYGFLQLGLFDQARAIWTEAQTVRRQDVDPRYPTYYGSAQSRFPSLFAIETRDWKLASSLKPVEGADWGGQGQTLLANAMAAGHLDDMQLAKTAEQSVESFTRTLPYLQRGNARASVADEIRAWARFAQGDLEGAKDLLRAVADRQAKLGKRELELPAREMLADMLLLTGKFTEALAEYQLSLESDPNRFNSLLGAGQAAEKLGKRKLAVGYYRTVLGSCECASGEAVKVLAQARSYIRNAER